MIPYWRLSGYYFFYFAFVGAFSPYFGLYLQSIGSTAAQIAVLMSLMSVMRMQLLNSRTVRLDGLGTFTVIARTRGKGVDKEKDVNPNQVTSLHFMFTPEYTRPAALGTTRALWQGVEFEKWTGGTATDGNEGSDDGNGGNAGGDGGLDENPLG